MEGQTQRRTSGVRPLLAPVHGRRLAALRSVLSVELLPDSELADQLAVAIGILALQVIEQATALTDQLEQAASRMMILHVRFEMFSQVVDALAEQRHLYFRGACIGVVRLIRTDKFRFTFVSQH